MPGLVSRIGYKKGPYSADEGDFASAGAAHIRLFNTLPNGIASVTLGENAYRRGLIADSVKLTTGNLLYSIKDALRDGNGVEASINGFNSTLNATDQFCTGGMTGRFGGIKDVL